MVTPSTADDPPRRRPDFSSPAPPPPPPPPSKRHPSSPPSRRSTQSRRLHNFSFPPTLSWGNQRVLRCVHPLANGGAADPSAGSPGRKRSSPSPSSPRRADEEAESSPAAAASRPWNLRTRRAAGNAPKNPNTSLNQNPNPHPNRSTTSSSSPSPSSPSPLRAEKSGLAKALRSRAEGTEKGGGERSKFAIGLSREEIEEDFLVLKGSKPPRRPKKRAKYVQRQLDSLFPGLWLSEITPDLYKIDDDVGA